MLHFQEECEITQHEMSAAHEEMRNFLQQRVFKAQHQRLDNKISEEAKQALAKI